MEVNVERGAVAAEKVERCPECGSRHIARDYERGELVCKECGLVIDELYIDPRPEWRAFTTQEREDRARADLARAPGGVRQPTFIDSRDRDGYGKLLSIKRKEQFYRLRKYDKWLGKSPRRNLRSAFSHIEGTCSRMGLPRQVRETSLLLYRKAKEEKVTRGRSVKAMAAAVVYAGCRQRGAPYTLEEIAEGTEVEKKELRKTYLALEEELGLSLLPVSPQDYIPRFCSKLGLSEATEVQALDIIERVPPPTYNGRSPSGAAAAAIYLASTLSGERRLQKEVAAAAGVCEVTIRNGYHKLAEQLGLDLSGLQPA